MSSFIEIKPQSPSQLGRNTVYNKSVTPWRVERLHVIFDVWSNDDLLKTSPCYFISERLRDGLTRNEFSGITVGLQLETETSSTFRGLYSDKMVPPYYLLRITGTAFNDDFGLSESNKLILSERAMFFLQEFNVADATVQKTE